MDFFRRLGQGRLAEILGEEFVETDRFFRMHHANGANSSLPDELAFFPAAFADGVNAFLRSHRDRLSIEFTLLGYVPELWAADDYLAIVKVVSWGLSQGWRVDLTAGKILETVGETRLKEAFAAWPEDGPVTVLREMRLTASHTAWSSTFQI